MAARLAVVVTAAGSSARFGPVKKELKDLDGRSVLEAAVSSFRGLPGLEALVVTAPRGREAEILAALSAATKDILGARLEVVPGGATRRDSVRAGLEAAARLLGLPESAGMPADEAGSSGGAAAAPGAAEEALVLVHDGARPWASSELALRVLAAAAERGAALPLVPLADTPKQIWTEGLAAAAGAREADGALGGALLDDGEGPRRGASAISGFVVGHPPRAGLRAAQTPQGFRLLPLLEAHRRAAAEALDCTDDAELWAAYVGPVAWVEGDPANRKVTYAQDLPKSGSARGDAGPPPPALPALRIGEGWDLHRLVPGRPLMLGGVEVPSDLGEEAHSDGDVLLHAVVDALLGAAALGDIGTHFPPSDPRWKGADSRELARKAAALVRAAGWEPLNLDCTVVLERPKLGPWKDAMRDSMAAVLGLGRGSVSVKAKTSEGVDAAGERRAVEARAAVLLAARGGEGAASGG